MWSIWVVIAILIFILGTLIKMEYDFQELVKGLIRTFGKKEM